MDNVQKHNICINVPSSQTIGLLPLLEFRINSETMNVLDIWWDFRASACKEDVDIHPMLRMELDTTFPVFERSKTTRLKQAALALVVIIGMRCRCRNGHRNTYFAVDTFHTVADPINMRFGYAAICTSSKQYKHTRSLVQAPISIGVGMRVGRFLLCLLWLEY
jgi:hypothetical protein